MSQIVSWIYPLRRSNRWKVGSLILGLGLVVLVAFLVHRRALQHDKHCTSSCANHAIQLGSLVRRFVDRGVDFPAETDTRTAFRHMALPGEFPVNWFTSYGSSCPESFMRDGSIGYVYVADGLSVAMARTNDALVFFCPATSHQRSSQHSHAITGNQYGMGCVDDNQGMIQVLEREIDRGLKGVVPYSARSMTIMEEELEARRRQEAAR